MILPAGCTRDDLFHMPQPIEAEPLWHLTKFSPWRQSFREHREDSTNPLELRCRDAPMIINLHYLSQPRRSLRGTLPSSALGGGTYVNISKNSTTNPSRLRFERPIGNMSFLWQRLRIAKSSCWRQSLHGHLDKLKLLDHPIIQQPSRDYVGSGNISGRLGLLLGYTPSTQGHCGHICQSNH